MKVPFPLRLYSLLMFRSATSAIALTVPGSADLWLAGMSNGATASYDYFNGGYDSAPGQSPVIVTEVPVTLAW